MESSHQSTNTKKLLAFDYLLVKTLYERSFLALPTLEYGSSKGFRSETDRLQIYVAATVEIW